MPWRREKMVPGLNASLGLGVMHDIFGVGRSPLVAAEYEGFKLSAKEKERKSKGERHTSDDLWALKVFIRMDVAGLESQVQANDK